jgi:hypothetical protein
VTDFIHDLHTHMGYPKTSAFEALLDMNLKDRRIVEILDPSREMEQERAAVKLRYESCDKFQAIKEAFSLDLDLELTCQQGAALHGYAPISIRVSRSRRRRL